MASLRSKFSWSGKKELDAGNKTHDKPSKQRASSVTSRKSMSSLFKRQDSPQLPDCQEHAHYPLYDPNNPEHYGLPASSGSSGRGQWVTPKKSRLRSIAQGLQEALRAQASYFYVPRSPDPPIPSPSSSISKKSVRFCEGHLVIDDERKLATSQATTPHSPKLPKLDFSLNPFDDVYTTEHLACDPVKAPASPKSLHVVVEHNSGTHKKTPDEEAAVLTDIRTSDSTATDKSEHAEHTAATSLLVESNSLSLRKCRVEIGAADVYGIAAVPAGQETIPTAFTREYTGEVE